MSDPGAGYVCDLTAVMRIRLFFGLYSSRVVAPRWRHLAQAHCIFVLVALILYVYWVRPVWHPLLSMLDIVPTAFLYCLAVCVSLWSGDEYIYKFFSQNRITDVSLDSPNIFSSLQKQIKHNITFVFVFFILYVTLHIVAYFSVGILIFVLYLMPLLIFDMMVTCFVSIKLLVMALFSARLLVLRRRLQRYGFRTVGRSQPQPYCQIYDEIWQQLDATNNPLKYLLLFDLIFSCVKITSLCASHFVQWNDSGDVGTIGLLIGLMAFTYRLFLSFGHVIFLEIAAGHCEDMAVFTATQLIKMPTRIERVRMLEFLRLLEQRGTRYHILRALPVNAQLLLSVLGFCSAQVLVIFSTLKTYSNM